MGRMPRLVELGKKDRRLGEPSEVSWEEIEALELDPRVDDPSPTHGFRYVPQAFDEIL